VFTQEAESCPFAGHFSTVPDRAAPPPQPLGDPVDGAVAVAAVGAEGKAQHLGGLLLRRGGLRDRPVDAGIVVWLRRASAILAWLSLLAGGSAAMDFCCPVRT
jgi:hypothetical protein